MDLDAPNHRYSTVTVTVLAMVLSAVSVISIAAASSRRVIGPRRTIDTPPSEALIRNEPTRRAARFVVVPIGLVVAVLVTGVMPVAIGAGVAVTVRRCRPLVAERRRRAAVGREMPDALDILVLSIRTGSTPRQAVHDVALHATESVRPAFAAAVHRTQRGQSFADSLAALPDMLGAPGLGVADALATSERYGLPLEPVLDQLSNQAREARRRLEQADARRLPVRLSFPLVVCTLPSFVLLAIAPAVIAALSSLGGHAW